MKHLLFVSFLISLCFAHKVNLFISNEGENIEIYSYFANGTACKNCTLLIKNDEKIILEDKLNKEGIYNYKSEYKNIEVIVDASGGHIVKKSFYISQIKHEDIKEYKQKEQEDKYLKIILGLFILLIFFYILKRFKK
ncbi:hypothetical protein [Sulfurimonas sp.]|uniref:hypothetical protein n=1 Tax=Sulfurimonas sp. TaxID=2022749 RepID=UPI0025EA19D5|nr:hypothetical protein [Sulfurimonas sp.]